MGKSEWSVYAQPLGHSAGTQAYAYNLGRHSIIESSSNPKNKKTGAYKRGGGFMVFHKTSVASTCQLPEYTYLGMKWGGAAAPVGSVSVLPTSIPASYSLPSYSGERTLLTPYGTKGWARARPGNQSANAFQFIYELHKLPTAPLLGSPRDRILAGGLKGLPGRLLSRAASFRGLGSEYLNIVFGWAPFVRDLQEMYTLMGEIDQKIAKLRRNNGRNNKRERTLVDSLTVTSSQTTNNGPFAYLYPTPVVIGGGSTTKTVTTTVSERIWFEGNFRYYVPNIGTQQWEKRAKRYLFGGGITPVNVWKVLPWSWLIDWFSNASDLFSNLSQNSVDNEVATYAYVMRTYRIKTVTTVRTSWGARSGSPGTYPAGDATASLTEETETKSRVVATPYGFGLTPSELTPYRAAILAALGMSQGRFSSR